MKKAISLLLAFVLAIGLLAGCGGDGDNGDSGVNAGTNANGISVGDVIFIQTAVIHRCITRSLISAVRP